MTIRRTPAPDDTTTTMSSETEATTTTTSSPPTQHKILLLNGPNLNLLGTREPAIYGPTTLESLTKSLTTRASALSFELLSYQSNHEGALVDRIHLARTEEVAAIIINPGAYTHTSVAIRDALTGVSIPFVEVHISNVHAREEFRHKSFLSEKAEAVVAGLGVYGYVAALEFWRWSFDGGKMKGI